MIPNNYWLYLQILFFLFITPGSPRIVICSYTMTYGLKKSAWTAIGDISANSLQLLLVVLGFGLIVKENPFVFLTLKWMGVGYLLYLAYDLYKSKVEIISSNKVIKNIYVGSAISMRNPITKDFFETLTTRRKLDNINFSLAAMPALRVYCPAFLFVFHF